MSRKGLIMVLIATGGMALIATALRHTQSLPVGPQPIAWDRENCAECRMMISDRRFAAQLQTSDGQTIDFDDPGCLIRFMARKRPSVRAVYFRNYSDDGWLTPEDVGFIRIAGSPMGHGWAAVPRTTLGSVSYERAEQQVAEESNQ